VGIWAKKLRKSSDGQYAALPETAARGEKKRSEKPTKKSKKRKAVDEAQACRG
jgi:hypothetical protein